MIELSCTEIKKKGNFLVPETTYTMILPSWEVAATVVSAILKEEPTTRIEYIREALPKGFVHLTEAPAQTPTPNKVKAILTLEIFPDRSWLLRDKDGKNLDIGRKCFSTRCGYCYEDGTSMLSFRHDGPLAGLSGPGAEIFNKGDEV